MNWLEFGSFMVTKKMKIVALFFIVLMFGSTFAYGIMSLFNQPTEQLQIPGEKIINFELNKGQRSYLMRRGYTWVEYRYSSGCLECIDVRENLEKLTMTSDGQIYLQELLSDENKITVTSLNGQKSVTNPTIDQTEDEICNLLMQRSIWCVTSQL